MASAIDPAKFVAGQLPSGAALNSEFTTARDEITALQAGGGGGGGGAISGWYDVTAAPYNADPTGASDSRAAIQAALDACGSAGGGVVWLPPGDYWVVNQSLAKAALDIRHSNVTVMGAGRDVTRITHRVYDGTALGGHPATTWEQDNGNNRAHRGIGLGVGQSINDNPPYTTLRNIVVRDLELYGGSPRVVSANPHSFPADINTGLGWDTTHQGLSLRGDRPFEKILIERVHVHQFQGECLYYGGSDCKDVTVQDCWSGNTNANALNIQGSECNYYRNYAYNANGNGYEGVFIGGFVFSGNLVENCRVGFGAAGRLTTEGESLIVGNRFVGGATMTTGIRSTAANTIISNNVVIDPQDTGILLIQPETALGNTVNYDREGQLVTGNIVCTVAQAGVSGITLLGYVDANPDYNSPLVNVKVSNNLVHVIDYTVADLEKGIGYTLTDNCRDVYITGNTVLGTRRGIQAASGSYPGNLGKIPYFRGNILRARERFLADNPNVATSGVSAQPLGSESIKYWHSTAFAEPVINAAHYMVGTRVQIEAPETNEPTYIPKRSASFSCETDRYLYAGTAITLEFDGTRFVEVEWRDGRSSSETLITSGTTLDGKGRTNIRLEMSGATTFSAHQGIPEGVPITISSSNGNATFPHNGTTFATGTGSSLTTVGEGFYHFVRRGAKLVQIP